MSSPISTKPESGFARNAVRAAPKPVTIYCDESSINGCRFMAFGGLWVPEHCEDELRAKIAGVRSACAVAIDREVHWDGGGTSLYFRDPAGNIVELAPPTLWKGLGL